MKIIIGLVQYLSRNKENIMKYVSDIFVEGDSLDWEEVAPGMKRKIMGYDDNIMMVHVHFEKG